MTPASPAQYRYRLSGIVEGEEMIFFLDAGEYRVGSSPASDVALPVRGVSRQHAILLVTPGGVVVEDRGSLNGSFVDGRRVERAVVPPGAELCFGPVRLGVEMVETEDSELAIVVAPGASEREPVSSGLVLDQTTRIPCAESPQEAIPGTWLALIDGFVARVSDLGDLAEALGFVVEALPVEGGCAVEWTREGAPLVLAAAGAIDELPPFAEVDELRPAPGEAAGSDVRAAFFDTDPVFSLAIHFGVEDEPRGLLLWGEYPGRQHSAPLLRAVVRLIDRLHPRTGVRSAADTTPPRYPDLVFPDRYRPGRSPAMAALYRQLRQLLKGDLPVLITGETGVGKELVAQILHASSPRRDQAFVAVNCAAIPSEMLEAEMFGIGKGVATGVEKRSGKFELAHGGTLFLDEIAEMPPPLQAKLLRALQEKEIHPVGGRPKTIDVWVVAATNADLLQRMRAETFRRDLFYRLAGCTVEVPPLRQCRDDIPVLVEHFLRLFAGETGTPIRGVTVKALRLLTSYPWPGNVRELEHEVRRLVYMATDGQVIDSGMLAAALRSQPPEEPVAELDSLALEPQLRDLELRLIREALRRTDGKQVQAAKLLGLSRNGLAKKMKRLGIRSSQDPGDERASESG